MQPIYPNKSEFSFDFEETINALTAVNNIVERSENSQKSCEVIIPEEKPILIWWMSDVHMGSQATDHQTFLKHLNLVSQTEGTYIAGIGDLMDSGVLAKFRSMAFEDTISPTLQTQLVHAVLQRVSEKLVAVVSGNHELFAVSEAGHDPALMYMEGIKAPYLRTGGVVNLKVGDQDYKLLLHHRGKFQSNFNPNHANRRIQESWDRDTDIVVSGHTHVVSVEVGDINDSYSRRTCHYIKAGTYKLNDEYSHEKGYAQGHVGGTCTIFSNSQKRMLSFRTLEDGIEILNYLRSL